MGLKVWTLPWLSSSTVPITYTSVPERQGLEGLEEEYNQQGGPFGGSPSRLLGRHGGCGCRPYRPRTPGGASLDFSVCRTRATQIN